MKKKVLSLFLCAALTAGMLTGTAFAAEEQEDTAKVEAAEEIAAEDLVVAEDEITATVDENAAEDTAAENEEPEVLDGEAVAATSAVHVDRVDVTIDMPTTDMTESFYRSTMKIVITLESGDKINVTQKCEWEPYEYYSFDYDDYSDAWNSDDVCESGRYYGYDIYVEDTQDYFCDEDTKIYLNNGTTGIYTEESGYEDGEDYEYISFALPAEAGNGGYLYYLEIPYKVIVKQGGNAAPGKKTFELDVKAYTDSDADVLITGNTIETNGVGTYKGTIKLSVKSNDELMEIEGPNVTVSMDKPADSKWTLKGGGNTHLYGLLIEWTKAYYHPIYAALEGLTVGSEDKWGGEYNIGVYSLQISDNDDLAGMDEADDITYTLTYTDNKTSKTTTTKTTSKSPATADNSMTTVWMLLMAAAVVGAAGTVFFRKREF